ncbi:YlbF family regulator [Paenibacillus alkalitolerans]|uniref:YlbF family regulator n=1 Tax=Paenibacillus alkalitolerans TaxID=2799335 RepID=UPI0018F760C7|nr:YlbF family regulator [Paenibacillus alkalitolerans]
MSVAERQALDISLLLNKASELGAAMLRTAELADYLYWKDRMAGDETVALVLRKMAKAKERFEECERFGQFHPNYHEALDEVKAVESEMEKVESIREFKKAEEALDRLLYDISVLIAHSVSDTVKVPSNDPLPKSGGGCGSGGCSGGCG